ncbi:MULTISPECIES: ABC transporter permease [unclassified Isoptericola]|uniref:ABC transporter permease n=1 Tax=unclassified Isoptericola TaxID=2623355 RepID=UPI002712299E|nr:MULTISPECIES: ABC transporter permease [unclassified Isoptericola]MDO8143204.1 ABC transporter permease [Isoptericola sp. 178]MDO8147065.1 ABC transporter permease [Isoptericola sp. b515]MDO8150620.1 ABC transporter permease [Isoptericola sp. b408]
MTTTGRTVGKQPVPPLPGTARLALVRGAVELRQFWRERDAVVFVFAYPVAMLAVFCTVFEGTEQGDRGVAVDYAQYFLPGMIATGIMLTSFQALATSIAVERDDGTLRRLRGTPLPAASYLGGKVVLTLVTSTLQTTLLLGVAAVVHDVAMPSEVSRWATFAVVYVLGAATGAACGVAFASLPRSGRSASTVVIPVAVVLQLVSGVFLPFFALPGWIQALASVFPLKWLAQGMRAVFLPDAAAAWETGGSWQVGTVAAVLSAWLVLSVAVAVRTFRWRRRDDG